MEHVSEDGFPLGDWQLSRLELKRSGQPKSPIITFTLAISLGVVGAGSAYSHPATG